MHILLWKESICFLYIYQEAFIIVYLTSIRTWMGSSLKASLKIYVYIKEWIGKLTFYFWPFFSYTVSNNCFTFISFAIKFFGRIDFVL